MNRRPRLLIFVLGYAATCMAIASSLGMLLVPAVAEEFDIPIATAQWMLTANMLAGAIITPVVGRLIDGRYKRRVLLGLLVVVLIGSTIAATATDFRIFLLGRALQGFTFGLGPITIALARTQLPQQMVGRAIAGLAITAATGLGLGYPLTGVLSGLFGFRSAFVFAIVFVATVAVMVLIGLPGGADPAVSRRPFDYGGAVLFGLGLATLLFLISEGPTLGWGSWQILGLGALSAIVLVAWCIVELRVRHPLVDVRVLRYSDVLLANATGLVFGSTMFICLSVVSLVAQLPAETGYGVGVPLMWAGFVMLPFSVGTFVASRVFKAMRVRLDVAVILPVGAACLPVALTILTFGHSELWQLLLGILLCGLGTGITFGAMPVLVARRVDPLRVGSALGFNAVLRTVGNSTGAAIPGSVFAATTLVSGIPSDEGIKLALGIGAVLAAVTTVGITVFLAVTHGRRSSL